MAGGAGPFKLLIVTEDDQRHTMPAGAAAVPALMILAEAQTVLAWDPANRILATATMVGAMPWTLDQ